MRWAAFILGLSLAACSTPQVQSFCGETEDAARIVARLTLVPIEVRAAALAIGAGSHVCGTPEYALLRERVIAWLRSR